MALPALNYSRSMGPLPAAKLSSIDRVGIALLILWVAWVIASAISHGSSFTDALPYLTAPAFAVLGWAAGYRLQTRGIPEWFAAFLLTLAIYVLVSMTVQGGAGGGPLGYANANAALGIQLTAVATITALNVNGQTRSWSLWAAALFALSVPWTLSQAGVALLVGVIPAFTLAIARPHKRRLWAVPLSMLAVGAAGLTIFYIARMSDWPSAFLRAFSGARQQLWSDAISLWAHHPITGGGPGAFAAYSRIADDSDTERVHMSLLQVGSELGLVGLAIFGTLLLLTFIKLAMAPPSPRFIAVAGLTALLIHSFIDHLLEFPATMLVAGAMVGLTSYSPPQDEVLDADA